MPGAEFAGKKDAASSVDRRLRRECQLGGLGPEVHVVEPYGRCGHAAKYQPREQEP